MCDAIKRYVFQKGYVSLCSRLELGTLVVELHDTQGVRTITITMTEFITAFIRSTEQPVCSLLLPSKKSSEIDILEVGADVHRLSTEIQ